MWRIASGIVLGAALCSAGLMSAGADDQKTEIKGGIEGKVKKVDVDGKTLTITTTQGPDRTFSITNETTMLGPRGGKVRRRLHDPRFHEGLAVTIVADGSAATEVHLGYDRADPDAKTEHKTRSSKTEPPAQVSRETRERTAGLAGSVEATNRAEARERRSYARLRVIVDRTRQRRVNRQTGSRQPNRNPSSVDVNVRAYAYWALRDMLDPERGQKLALPPDQELLSDLSAPRWAMTMQGLKVEPKEDIVKRLGRSPACAVAVFLAILRPPVYDTSGPKRLIA